MTGLVQTLSDLKLIIATDRRIWAACAFLLVVGLVYSITDSWRVIEPPPPEKLVPVKIHEEKIVNMVKGFNQAIKESAEERKYLKEYLSRVSNKIESDKEEIDWHVDTIINRVNDVTEKIDNLTHKVGEQRVQKTHFDRKLIQQTAKKTKEP